MSSTTPDYIIPDALPEHIAFPTQVTKLTCLYALQAYTAYRDAMSKSFSYEYGGPRTNAYKCIQSRYQYADEVYMRALRTYSTAVGKGPIECAQALHKLYVAMKCDDRTRMERIDAQVGRLVRPPTRRSEIITEIGPMRVSAL